MGVIARSYRSEDIQFMWEEEMEEEGFEEKLPDKSRSLRKTSVRKRLETEIKKRKGKLKEKVSKKRTLSKYRRKAANAKERERMKKMNDVFDTLKSVIPAENRGDDDDEKETKVTTLRSAIAYINCLKQLIEDCDAGLVDKTQFDNKEKGDSEPKDKINNKAFISNSKKIKKEKKNSKAV